MKKNKSISEPPELVPGVRISSYFTLLGLVATVKAAAIAHFPLINSLINKSTYILMLMQVMQ